MNSETNQCNHEHHDCCGHHHEETNKYLDMLALYNTKLNDAEVSEAVRKIIAEKVHENDNDDVKRFLFGSIELTSLATICTYPCYASIVSQTLEVEGVEVTCVSAGFPSSQMLPEIKVAETALAVKDGATEIDIVMSVGKFLSGDYEGMCDEISEIKSVCGDDVPLKVILETGDIKTAENIKKASLLAMYAGADYIKTSTGKEPISATPEAAYVMCQAIKEYHEKTGIKIGFKPAGGINTVMDAIIYYTIVKEVLGKEWLTNKYLRLGTSRLTNLLLSELTGQETKFF